MSNPSGSARRLFIWTAVISLLLDQASKLLAHSLLHPYVPHQVLGQMLRLVLVSNPRGLFGMSYGPIWMHYVLPLLGMCFVIYFAWRSSSRWSSVAFGLILAGGLGNNLIDRVRLGSVIDFIDFGFGNWRWYTFNLADAFVVVGVIMLLWYEFFGAKQGTIASAAAGQEPGKTGLPSASGRT
ncbi:MAG: signal peptidase II [candidate division WOR-3 bacterium]|nr:signal peptidase II [candidate division WOR-3 bacterium]